MIQQSTVFQSLNNSTWTFLGKYLHLDLIKKKKRRLLLKNQKSDSVFQYSLMKKTKKFKNYKIIYNLINGKTFKKKIVQI